MKKYSFSKAEKIVIKLSEKEELCSTDSYKLDEIDSLSTESVLSAMIDNCLFPFIRQFANIDLDGFNNCFKNIPIWLKKTSTLISGARISELLQLPK